MTWTKGLAASALAVLAGLGLPLLAGRGSEDSLGLSVPVVCGLIAYLMQWLAFVPAYAARTERFFDLWGATSYIVCTVVALWLSPPSPRGAVIACLVAIWAARLGGFLVLRIRRQGTDSRFDAIKTSGPRFFLAWTLQGTWISMTLLAATLAISAGGPAAFGIRDAVGIVLWVLGIAIETIADEQKTRFRRNHPRGGFIQSGLWAWSRHPNYFGEILLWTGIAVLASTALSGAAWLGLSSPVFVFLLLRFGSGIPMLEQRADQRWGHLPAYQTYKRQTPLLLPLPRRRV